MSRLSCLTALAALTALSTNPAYGVLRHEYLFQSGDGIQILDTAGTAHGSALTYVDGVADTPTSLVDTSGIGSLNLNGVDQYGRLPGPDIDVTSYSEVTLEVWFSQTNPANQFTFVAGLGTTAENGLGNNYLMLQPTRGPGDQGSRGAITPGTFDSEVGVTDGARDLNDGADGTTHQMAMTVNDTDLAYYVDGALIGTAPLNGVTLADVSNDFAYLGKALYNDPYFIGSIYEFNISDNALSDVEIQAAYDDGCNTFYDCTQPIRLEVDRDTGVATLKNDRAAQRIVLYTISSASGTIDPISWTPVADTGDVDSGGQYDADDLWRVDVATSVEITEQEPVDDGHGGPSDGFGVGVGGVTEVDLGALWAQSPFEDLVMTATFIDESFQEFTLDIPVSYFGNGDESFVGGDFDLDGDVDADDYNVLLTNHLQTLVGTTGYETYFQGDVNGDGMNDFNDFRAFKNAFIAENGAAAFAALTAIPEPSAAALLTVAVAGVAARRRK